MRASVRVTVAVAALAAAVVASTGLWGASASVGAVRPAAGHDTFLNAVAPVSKTSAWAVGSVSRGRGQYDGLVQHWDGKAWSNAFVYGPSGSAGGGLYAVAAVSDSDVWTVGSYENQAGNGRASLLHWDGSTWSPVSTAGLHLGGNCSLSGVAALAADDVWIVGWSYPAHAVKAVPVALHWDGTTLSRVAMPAPPKGQGFLSSVSAASPTDVWAVGSVMLGLREQTLIEHWDGTSWSEQDSSKLGGDLENVYASGPKSGWAIGFSGKPLILHLSDGSWNRVRLPKADAGFELYGVGGTSDDDVWVVGDDRRHSSSTTLTLHWNGTHWSRVESPTKGAFATLNGVAAGPTGDTWAVGGHTVKGSDDQRPIHELWTGSRWVMR